MVLGLIFLKCSNLLSLLNLQIFLPMASHKDLTFHHAYPLATKKKCQLTEPSIKMLWSFSVTLRSCNVTFPLFRPWHPANRRCPLQTPHPKMLLATSTFKRNLCKPLQNPPSNPSNPSNPVLFCLQNGIQTANHRTAHLRKSIFFNHPTTSHEIKARSWGSWVYLKGQEGTHLFTAWIPCKVKHCPMEVKKRTSEIQRLIISCCNPKRCLLSGSLGKMHDKQSAAIFCYQKPAQPPSLLASMGWKKARPSFVMFFPTFKSGSLLMIKPFRAGWYVV